MKKKGFTLIELLVVISIIAMLMAILMPALGKVRKLANQLVCGTHLSGLGKACAVYANQNDEEYPVAGGVDINNGGSNVEWATKGNQGKYWDDPNPDWNNKYKKLTVSASLYLLVRNVDVSPKQFVCPSGGETDFTGEGAKEVDGEKPSLVDLWDFGGDGAAGGPSDFVSYSYQYPYKDQKDAAYPLYSSAPSGMAVMADKSPWYDLELTPSNSVVSTSDNDGWNLKTMLIPIDWGDNGHSNATWMYEIGNSGAHGRVGQNVLFNDTHVDFKKRSDVGVNNDNIYCPQKGADSWTEDQIRQGAGKFATGKSNIVVKNDKDNVLVNDDQH